MEKIDTTRIFSIIAAVFYGLIALSFTIIAIRSHGDVSFVFITYFIEVICFTIAFFIRNGKFVIILSCIHILRLLYFFIHGTIFNKIPDWEELCACIAYIALLCLSFFVLKKKTIVGKIWFVPGVVYVIGLIIGLFSVYGYPYYNYFEMLALFAAGLWLKEEVSPFKFLDKSSSVKQNLLGGADQLKSYKDLLDSGIITQEEFETKKKQLMNVEENEK